MSLARQWGYPGGLVWCQVARVLQKLRSGDMDAARDWAARLADTVSSLQGQPILERDRELVD